MENFLLILAVLLLFLTGFLFTAGIDRIERRVRRGEKSEKKNGTFRHAHNKDKNRENEFKL